MEYKIIWILIWIIGDGFEICARLKWSNQISFYTLRYCTGSEFNRGFVGFIHRYFLFRCGRTSSQSSKELIQPSHTTRRPFSWPSDPRSFPRPLGRYLLPPKTIINPFPTSSFKKISFPHLNFLIPVVFIKKPIPILSLSSN